MIGVDASEIGSCHQAVRMRVPFRQMIVVDLDRHDASELRLATGNKSLRYEHVVDAFRLPAMQYGECNIAPARRRISVGGGLLRASSWPGLSRLVPAIHALLAARRRGYPAQGSTRPGMTKERSPQR